MDTLSYYHIRVSQKLSLSLSLSLLLVVRYSLNVSVFISELQLDGKCSPFHLVSQRIRKDEQMLFFCPNKSPKLNWISIGAKVLYKLGIFFFSICNLFPPTSEPHSQFYLFLLFFISVFINFKFPANKSQCWIYSKLGALS